VSLSQSVMDGLGAEAAAMYGGLMETVTYRHQAPGGAVTTLSVALRLKGYSERELRRDDQLLHGDRQARIQTSSITFAPGQSDEFTQADSTRWRVITPSRGPGHPWWICQVRKATQP